MSDKKWVDNYEEYQNAGCMDNSDYPVYRGKPEEYPEPAGCRITTEAEGDWVVDDK